ncbi:MAG TPA: peptidylprolyl isomerase [Longimicrobium sp.]|nr:peptidylprolyl isomerase [Longimicrobium sp.]
MRALNALALAVLLAVPAAAAAQQSTAQPGPTVWDRVVATVGDTAVLYSDLMLELESMQAQGQQVPTDPAARSQLLRDVLNRRVDDLLLLEAARRAGTEVPPVEVAASVEAQINRIQGQFPTPAAFEQALAQSGRTIDEYRRTLTQQYSDQTQIQRYVRDRVSRMSVPPVSEADVEQFFATQRAQLGQRPATVSFQQAIVKPQASDSADARARRKAEEVLVELRRGGDFEALARRHSQDPSGPNGGMLGWFRQGQMVRPFEAVAYALRPGDISPVVKTEYGYHIIKLEKVRGAERQARHILIRPEITEADIAAARQRADSIATAVRGGGSIADAGLRTGTPVEQRNLRDVLPERLPPEYSAALGTSEIGSVVGPFQVEAGGSPTFVVAKMNERRAGGEYTLADVKEQVRERLVQNRQVERLLAELRQVTAVSLRL